MPKRFLSLIYVLSLAATGCGIQGKWSVVSVDPTAARRDFPYDAFTLQDDGTFYAETHEPQAGTATGTYRYDDNALSFRERSGSLHTYKATRHGNDKLELECPWTDRLMITMAKRQKQ